MTVLVAALGDPSLDARVGGTVPDYKQESGEFALNRPIGDDWGQYIRHVPNPGPLLVRIEERTMFVVFRGREDAVRFEEWLRDALREQEHGFNTMRG
jgi:hypothetical protein